MPLVFGHCVTSVDSCVNLCKPSPGVTIAPHLLTILFAAAAAYRLLVGLVTITKYGFKKIPHKTHGTQPKGVDFVGKQAGKQNILNIYIKENIKYCKLYLQCILFG